MWPRSSKPAPKPTPLPPDAWTPARKQRCRLLEICDGDVTKARTALQAHQRQCFARWLVEKGRVSG